ncbi:uncharacterized protein LOC127277740 [Leptopilina boulardi]|uniref:uncharacterized protein LOC127277740 n=1 Tax=Leptopilina boulardi TaxID=63433 RepID=UPI0021F59916|nr:uncharacterized protein LOC127277740 [Leptopilina boulardi]XP_051155021.1 uncharacterized protein LOC127277740 [Leptopilina boulardi]
MQAVPNIIKAMKVQVPADGTNNGTCVLLILNLPKLFLKAKKTGRIYRAYPRGSTFAELIPNHHESPSLLPIADSNTSFDSLELMFHVDGDTLFKALAFDAVLYLISAYWVFNISFPSNAKLQYSFISIAIFRQAGIKQMKNNVLKSIVLHNALKEFLISYQSDFPFC